MTHHNRIEETQKKEFIYEDDPQLEDVLLEWYLEALDKFEMEYGEINPHKSWKADAEKCVAYVTTIDGREFKLYYAWYNKFLGYYRKCYVVASL